MKKMRTTSLLLCRLSLLVNLASLDAPSQSSADRSTVIRKSVKRLDSTVLSLGYSVISSFLCKFLIFRHGKNEPPAPLPTVVLHKLTRVFKTDTPNNGAVLSWNALHLSVRSSHGCVHSRYCFEGT